ncbi:MAG TPA: putative sulfate exporter family transporter, partial [Mizugakiibacter sp.]
MHAPGLLLTGAIAAVALALGKAAPLIGGPVIGIVLGIAVRTLRAPGAACAPGIRYASKQVLQASIVALGFGLSLGQVARTGLHSLSVTAVTITAAFVAAWALGRALRV